MLPKCYEDQANIWFEQWKRDYHAGHDAVLGNDYDEYLEATLNGRAVLGDSYFGLLTEKIAESYKRVPFMGEL